MLMVNRFVVPEADEDQFAERARTALSVLSARPGYVRGQLGRELNDPVHWCLVTEWESVGAYRRAMGGFDVKVHATPLLASALPDASTYEVLASAVPGGPVEQRGSDRA